MIRYPDQAKQQPRANRLRWLLLGLIVLIADAAWAQIELPSVFGHNMVLQKDLENVIYGKGPPSQKIWVEYKGLQWSGKTANDGTWQGILNLKKWRVEPGPGSLYLGLGKQNQQPLLELTNVVVGKVWLFAGWDSVGIPATAEDRTPIPDRLRFITIKEIMNLKSSVTAGVSSWDYYPTQAAQYQRFPKLALLVANALVSEKDYVGIVLTTSSSLAPAFLGRRSPTGLENYFQTAWILGSNSVLEAQTARQKQLIRYKREGKVVELPQIYQYEKIAPCFRDSFHPNEPPVSLLSFEGAVWPFER